MKKRASSRKKPLTPAQRLAIDRQRAERECREALDAIMKKFTDPNTAAFYHIPPNYRTRTACALNVVLLGGHVFALACAKAYLARTDGHRLPKGQPPTVDIEDTYKQAKADIWRFIDEQNTLFAERIDQDMLERWNAPDYDLPPETNQPAQTT